jgi:hypothetical protein
MRLILKEDKKGFYLDNEITIVFINPRICIRFMFNCK